MNSGSATSTSPRTGRTRTGSRIVDAPEGAEVPLPATSHGVMSRAWTHVGRAPRRAVVAQRSTPRSPSDQALRTRSRRRASTGRRVLELRGPRIFRTTLVRADLRGRLRTIVAGVACGWRKPDARVFERTADALDCNPPTSCTSAIQARTPPSRHLGGTFVDVRDAAGRTRGRGRVAHGVDSQRG